MNWGSEWGEERRTNDVGRGQQWAEVWTREKADVASMRTVLHGGAVSYGLAPLAVSGSLKNTRFEAISETLRPARCPFPDQRSPKMLNTVMMARHVLSQGLRGAWVPRQLGAVLLWFSGVTDGGEHLSTLKPRSVLMVKIFPLLLLCPTPLFTFIFSVQRRHMGSGLPS